MSTLTPQTYTPSTLYDAVLAGCDVCQPKYNGQWVRVEVSRGFLRFYDAGQKLIEHEKNLVECSNQVCGTFIGNLLLDQSKIVLWDCWALCNDRDPTNVHVQYSDIEGYTYRDRFALLKAQVNTLSNPFCHVIANFPITQARMVWENITEAHVCGLVFRRSSDPVRTSIRIARKYREVPGELV